MWILIEACRANNVYIKSLLPIKRENYPWWHPLCGKTHTEELLDADFILIFNKLFWMICMIEASFAYIIWGQLRNIYWHSKRSAFLAACSAIAPGTLACYTQVHDDLLGSIFFCKPFILIWWWQLTLLGVLPISLHYTQKDWGFICLENQDFCIPFFLWKFIKKILKETFSSSTAIFHIFE